MKRKGKCFIRASMWLMGAITFLTSCSSSPPTTLGLKNGKLRPCPDTPNCVLSYEAADAPQKVKPLAWTQPSHPKQQLQNTIEATGGSVQRSQGHYMWAIYTSTLFRFVDDVEFHWVPEEQTIHIRSASRLGYSDLGANRRRVESIHQQWLEAYPND